MRAGALALSAALLCPQQSAAQCLPGEGLWTDAEGTRCAPCDTPVADWTPVPEGCPLPPGGGWLVSEAVRVELRANVARCQAERRTALTLATQQAQLTADCHEARAQVVKEAAEQFERARHGASYNWTHLLSAGLGAALVCVLWALQ